MAANFFSDSFMARRRQQWLRSILRLEVRTNGTWYEGDIQKKEVQGDTLVLNVVFSAVDNMSCTIDRSRIFDVYGEVIHEQVEAIKKAKGQGTMIQIKVPIKEPG